MDCFYINLKAQAERRHSIEKNFAEKKGDGWRLFRFDAVDVTAVNAMNVSDAARPAEKACFLSHKNVLMDNIGRDTPLVILEDDALFGDRTCRAIETGLR